MALLRAAVLYPRNGVTNDTGGAIDVRTIDDANGGTNDATQTVTATHTEDNASRTFDPATNGGVGTSPSTLSKIGWSIPLAEMTPDDDTRCNSILPAGSLIVNVDVTLTAAGGTGNLGGTIVTTFQAALFKYNPSTDTGSLIAAGGNTQQWSTVPVTGDQGTFKVAACAVTVASVVEFAANEVLLLQLGFSAAGTLPNPLTGTTTYTWTLRVDDANTNITWATDQGIRQRCLEAQSGSGVGVSAKTLARVRDTRTATGVGIGTTANVLTADEAGFETSEAGWTVSGSCTGVRSTAQAHSGSASLLVTRTSGGPASSTALGPHRTGFEGAAGLKFTASGWVRPVSTTRTGFPTIAYYDSANAFLGQSIGPSITETAGVWTQFVAYGTALVNTARVQVNFVWQSVANSEGHYLDDVTLALGSKVRVRDTRLTTAVGSPASTYRTRHTRLSTAIGTASRLVRVRDTRTSTGIGVASRSLVRVRDTRLGTAVGVSSFSRLWTVFREDTATAVGSPSSTRIVRDTRQATAIGTPTFVRHLILQREDQATGIGSASRTARARVLQSSTGVGETSFSRLWTAARSAQAIGVGVTDFVRHIIFVRNDQATAVGRLTARIELDIEDLPTSDGGSPIIVKKVFGIFD